MTPSPTCRYGMTVVSEFPGILPRTTPADVQFNPAINYRGIWLCSRAQLGAMVRQDPLDGNVPGRAPERGAIVNIASQLGIVSKAKMGNALRSESFSLFLSLSLF
jgi:NAD(P)-dependent dehydrogenase (short-subunit alcohol dehydrogenase family)